MPPCALKSRDCRAEAEVSPGERLCTSGRGSGSNAGPQQGGRLTDALAGTAKTVWMEVKKNNRESSLLRCARPPGWEKRKCIGN